MLGRHALSEAPLSSDVTPAAPVVVPDFFSTRLYPDWFPQRYPEHMRVSVQPQFEQLPAPDTGRPYSPDRLHRLYPWQPAVDPPPPFQTLPAPTTGTAYYL